MQSSPDILSYLRTPVMNAAGSLGFAPRWRGPVDLARLGAFITNPVSLGPRAPADGRRVVSFPGGFLLHTGLPNPGLMAVLREHAKRWEASELPIIVHLLVSGPDDVARMIAHLESASGVMGVEIGLPPGAPPELAYSLADAAATRELPFIINLLAGQLGTLGPELHRRGASALSLAPPYGSLPIEHGLVSGRLYGPALLPHTLAAVRQGAHLGLQIIAAGGLYHPADVTAAQSAGAVAVQLDAVLWAP